MQFNLELKNKTIVDENLRWVEIYRITNKINKKVYIGQAISHRKNNNKYTPKGMEGRFKQHIKESKLYQKYKDRGLMIIGVPSNNFGSQEPGSNEEIQRFCKYNYGVNFLVTQKEIVTGKEAHPFYLFAKEKLGALSSPKWNFHKYLIGRDGKLVDYFISSTTPESEKIINAIEKELNK